jgi:hypothetical protein
MRNDLRLVLTESACCLRAAQWSIWFQFFLLVVMLVTCFLNAFERARFIYLTYLALVTSLLTITSRNFEKCGIFESYAEYELVFNYYQLQKDENHFFMTLARFVGEEPIWTQFLAGVRGCGPAMAGVILSEIDITKTRYASSLWRYCGLAVEADGRGTGRHKEHLVDHEYIDSEGNPATRRGITFNPFLKTKMVGVLGSSFVKQPADKCQYRRIYDQYKHRLENHHAWQDKTKAHRHNAAVRYMVKMFLLDLWREWRTLEGLDTPDPYHVAKLQLRDHAMAA